jgi:hypothetical protein
MSEHEKLLKEHVAEYQKLRRRKSFATRQKESTAVIDTQMKAIIQNMNQIKEQLVRSRHGSLTRG